MTPELQGGVQLVALFSEAVVGNLAATGSRYLVEDPSRTICPWTFLYFQNSMSKLPASLNVPSMMDTKLRNWESI